MRSRNLLVGATALTTLGAPPAAFAAEVKPGGALDLTITGFLRAEAFGGEQDDLSLNSDLSRKLDFRNDTEVHVLARARSEELGLEYGATIEFEADTNNTANTDETWIFLRGGWGEVRLGDEDGVAENSALGAQDIAAGTGGIDGSDAIVVGNAPYVFLVNTNDATKIRYYTPSFGGFSVGVSYTPTQQVIDSGSQNGQFRAQKSGPGMEAKNVVEGGLIYDGDLGGVGLEASVVGLYGRLRNEREAAFGGSDWWGVQGGAVIDLFGFELAGSVATNNIGDLTNNFMNAGVAYGFGPLSASLNYAWSFDANNDFEETTGLDDPNTWIVSATYLLAPGLALQGDVAWFDNDTNDFYDGGTGDQGWAAVGRFEVTF